VHIADGLITNVTSIAAAVVMWMIFIAFLAWQWKKAKATYSHSITALLAISSAFVFAAQMINFPIAFGTSGHLVGGTFLAVLLGPYAAMLSMTPLYLFCIDWLLGSKYTEDSVLWYNSKKPLVGTPHSKVF
jgi:cobalt/nickel transport system permease protein